MILDSMLSKLAFDRSKLIYFKKKLCVYVSIMTPVDYIFRSLDEIYDVLCLFVCVTGISSK